MNIIYSRSFFVDRTIVSSVLFLTCLFSKAGDFKKYTPDDVYVVINNSKAKLQNLFTLIEKQTSYSFAYDENDINLSKQVKLSTGQQLLKIVLIEIENQTNLDFTVKANLILVNTKPSEIKKAETNIFTNQTDRFPVSFHHAGANAGDVMRLSGPGK